MATVTRVYSQDYDYSQGATPLVCTASFAYDDVSLLLTGVRVDNQTTRPFNYTVTRLSDNSTVSGTVAAGGALNRNVSALGIVGTGTTRGDGSVFVRFPVAATTGLG